MKCRIGRGGEGEDSEKKRKLKHFFWFAVCSMLGLIALLGFIFLPFFLRKWGKKKQIEIKEADPLFPLETLWYYLDDSDTQHGPVSYARLLELREKGHIQENHYIWHESFSHWKKWTSVFPKENTPIKA